MSSVVVVRVLPLVSSNITSYLNVEYYTINLFIQGSDDSKLRWTPLLGQEGGDVKVGSRGP